MASTLILLHALGASGGAWAEVTARLGSRYPYAAPDLPGFGKQPALRLVGERVGFPTKGTPQTLDAIEIGVALHGYRSSKEVGVALP